MMRFLPKPIFVTMLCLALATAPTRAFAINLAALGTDDATVPADDPGTDTSAAGAPGQTPANTGTAAGNGNRTTESAGAPEHANNDAGTGANSTGAATASAGVDSSSAGEEPADGGNGENPADSDGAADGGEPGKPRKRWWNNMFITGGPMLLLNRDDVKKSAPSPIMYAGGIGKDFFQDRLISFTPRLSFFTNYYLYDGEDAQPAEVENRTATGLSFLLDLTAGHTWRFKQKNYVSAQLGLGFLARYGILSNGVHSGDEGWSSDSTAGDDVKSINSWFWKKMRFLYPQVALCYMHDIPFGLKAGIEARAYFPTGLFRGGGFDDALFSLALKVEF